MKKIIVGICNTNKEIPVEKFIFNENIESSWLQSTAEIRNKIFEFLEKEVGITTSLGRGINSASYTDDEIWVGKKELCVYVSGPTFLTAQLIELCAINGIKLTLMHYDPQGSWYAQRIF